MPGSDKEEMPEYASDDDGGGPEIRVDKSLADLANTQNLSSTPTTIQPPPAAPPAPQSGGGMGDGWGSGGEDDGIDVDDDEGGVNLEEFAEDDVDVDDGAQHGFNEFTAAQDFERMERNRVTQLLSDLDELEGRGWQPPKRYNHTSDPDELAHVVHVGQQALQRKSGTAISKKLLTGFVGVVEMMNHQFDPLGLKLDGFSDSVVGNIADYEDVLGRLYMRYGSSFGEQHPAIELVIMLGLAGAQVHMMNVWAENQKQKYQAATPPTPPPAVPAPSAAAAGSPPQPKPQPSPPPMAGIPMGEISGILSQVHAASTQEDEVVPFRPRPPVQAAPKQDEVSALDKALDDAKDQADAIVIDIPQAAAGRKKK